MEVRGRARRDSARTDWPVPAWSRPGGACAWGLCLHSLVFTRARSHSSAAACSPALPVCPCRCRRRTWAASWSCLRSARAKCSTCSPASRCVRFARTAAPARGRPTAAASPPPHSHPHSLLLTPHMPPPHSLTPSRHQGTTRLTFKIATRGLLGLKNALLTATRGLGLLNTLFDSYRPVAGGARHAARACLCALVASVRACVRLALSEQRCATLPGVACAAPTWPARGTAAAALTSPRPARPACLPARSPARPPARLPPPRRDLHARERLPGGF